MLNSSLPTTDAHYYQWVQIVNAFPKKWKTIIVEDKGHSIIFCEFRPHIISNAKLYPMDKLNAKEIYNACIKSIIKVPTAQRYFTAMLNIDSLPWKNIYNLARIFN